MKEAIGGERRPKDMVTLGMTLIDHALQQASGYTLEKQKDTKFQIQKIGWYMTDTYAHF